MAAYSPRALVFANGEFGRRALEHVDIRSDDFIVCVDGGLQHATQSGLQADLLIGDFDSAQSNDLNSPANADVERITHPANKDASDLALALGELGQRHFQEVALLGISGGRTDHSLFNWMLPALQAWPFQLRLVDETADAYVINRTHSLSVKVRSGCLVSLLPLRPVAGVTTSGLEYPLSNASITPGSTLGLSNVACAPVVSVEIASGVMLALINY